MIDNRNIKIGAIFQLNPGVGSHSQEPYKVVVVSIDSYGFETEVYGDPPPRQSWSGPLHRRRFDFNQYEWKSYHRPRFEKVTISFGNL